MLQHLMNFLIFTLTAGVLFSVSVFPGSSLQKLIFIEDTLWGISWLLIARQSYRSCRSGFPPLAMGMTLAVELYLMVHFVFIRPWPFHPWLLVNYIVWPLTSLFNLAAVIRFSRDEISPQRLGWETGIYFGLFALIAIFLSPHLVMAYLGQGVILLISFHFLFRIIRSDVLSGMSMSGNIVRVLAGLLCFIANFILRYDELKMLPVLLILMALSVVVDLGFMFVYIRKSRRMN